MIPAKADFFGSVGDGCVIHIRFLVRQTFVLMIIFLCAPSMIFIALSIRFLGQNPIFKQRRVGLGGKEFNILKFRTVWDETASMRRPNNLQRTLHAIAAKTLRSTGLDELPQLVNILRHDMTFIGPRPLTPEDHALLPPGRDLRLTVRPGLTGLAQINGGQTLSPDDKLAFDLYYIQRRSAQIDGYIFARSLLRLVRGQSVTSRVDQCLQSAANAHWRAAMTGDQMLVHTPPGTGLVVQGSRGTT